MNESSIGIVIKDDIKIGIGDNFGEVLDKIEKSGLKYQILFDKVSKATGVRETIIHIDSEDIEVTLLDDRVNYIKSVLNETTRIIGSSEIEYKNLQPPDIMNIIKDFVAKHVGTGSIYLEKFDMRTYVTTVRFRWENREIRASVSRTNDGDLYLNTVSLI